MNWIQIIAVCLSIVYVVRGQENAQTRIPTSLLECYENLNIFERDNRLPMTINTLIAILRKVEDSPDQSEDLRQFSSSVIHRFRQDGIERAPNVAFNQNILPFSPSGFQFFKHRIGLTRLIPGNAIRFPNATLTPQERCTLHFMLSSSISREVRGDEGQRCSQLAQYRTHRIIKRSIDSEASEMEPKDLKALNDINNYRKTKRARYQMEPSGDGEADVDETPEGEEPQEPEPEEDIEEGIDIHVRMDDVGFADQNNGVPAVSQCPVENGVIRTRWGAVSPGIVLTGIAAGLDAQQVTTRELMALSRHNSMMGQQTETLMIDNRWATTIAGDLAEVALFQGPMNENLAVGAPGAWNSTVIPQWYFLAQRERFEMTDAEIRGGLDGLILAQNIIDWRNAAASMRLSQVLDMYYSHGGVLHSRVRACDRRTLFTQVAPLAAMQAQTTAFATVLERDLQLRVTMTPQIIQTFSNAAAVSLSNYVPQGLNDLSCATSLPIPNDETILRTAAELYLFVDTTHTFLQISPVIAALIDGLDVHRFGSFVTILNANDGAVMIPRTNDILDVFSSYNATVHQNNPSGMSLPNIIREIRVHTTNLMNAERANSTVGGRSKIAIILPSTAATPSEADTNIAIEQLRIIREQVPDLNLFFFGSGNIQRFGVFVRQPERDLFPLTVSATNDFGAQASANPVITRIQQVPRRVINHRCGADWQTNEWGGNAVNQYVEPGGIVFYRLHPNYFFGAGSNRRLRIQGHGYSVLNVCTSRWVELPRMNNQTEQQDVNCRQINSDAFEVNLDNPCDGFWTIHQCPPVFISVEGVTLTGQQSIRCVDHECRFPHNLRFGIHAEQLGCFNTANGLTGSILLAAIAWILCRLF